MDVSSLIARAGRLLRKPPGYLVRRIAHEIKMESDRVLAPAQARRMSGKALARMAGVADVDALWDLLARRPYPVVTSGLDRQEFERLFPGAEEIIFSRAQDALAHRIDLLGTGPVELGARIDWLQDFKTGDRWPAAFCRSIDYMNRGRPSDVKVPWELSRLQWLLPAGQAFVLTGDEAYARGVRDVIEQWIDANPYAWSVNWSCTMEPALRLQTWTWFFHVFARSEAWRDATFRSRFLSMLYLHGAFTEKHIERSTINGNHLTADAAGMVFAGLFFRGIGDADRWAEEGWRTLVAEMPLQVHEDGVDFEASTAYHRLVTELFLMPARYRLAAGLPIAADYRARLEAMGKFAAAYTRPDGTSPNWGDADDGRALPMGTQALGDHRYLVPMIEATFGSAAVAVPPAGGDEIAWHCGLDRIGATFATTIASQAFPQGGVYILAAGDSHVFIDCGPVGLAGLGGHGHNDPLSLDAWLGGEPLIVDPGSYVYTASFEDRQAFRSTAYHNTPQLDGIDANRLHAPDNLWNMHDDARAECLAFEPTATGGRFAGRHFGYERLSQAAIVLRTVRLDGALTVEDEITGEGRLEIEIPYHLAPGVTVFQEDASFRLAAGGRAFRLTWEAPEGSELRIEDARFSPSYGVAVATKKLVLRLAAALPARICIRVEQI